MEKSLEHDVNNLSIKTKRLSKNNKQIIKILKRKEFLVTSSKFKVRSDGFNLQAIKRTGKQLPEISKFIRVGFTCSKKVGNAVQRNKAKRRLRHLARECLPTVGEPGWDYVLIGHRKYTQELNFIELKKSFVKAINQIHKFEKFR